MNNGTTPHHHPSKTCRCCAPNWSYDTQKVWSDAIAKYSKTMDRPHAVGEAMFAVLEYRKQLRSRKP